MTMNANHNLHFSEPGLMDELTRRVEEAETPFQAEDLDQALRDLEAAKQRQVKILSIRINGSKISIDKKLTDR